VRFSDHISDITTRQTQPGWDPPWGGSDGLLRVPAIQEQQVILNLWKLLSLFFDNEHISPVEGCDLPNQRLLTSGRNRATQPDVQAISAPNPVPANEQTNKTNKETRNLPEMQRTFKDGVGYTGSGLLDRLLSGSSLTHPNQPYRKEPSG
jgi:hypothetical protein